MDKIRILFLAANPLDTNRLALDEEIREITAKIRSSEHRDLLEIISAWAVRPDDLLQLLNTHKPHIVHFSGHGTSTGEIVLMDDDRQAKPINNKAIKSLFKVLKDNIQIVVLNACYSKPQAQAINEVIDYVIGMNVAIGDRAAIVFAASFYRAIGFDRLVQQAFEQARTALLLEGISEDSTPELLIRSGVDIHEKILATDSLSDAELLKQHRRIFQRPAFSEACIDEVSLRELSEAVDDSQAALNTGSLFSRNGNLLSNFPDRYSYKSDEFREVFTRISHDLTNLKLLIKNLENTLYQVDPTYSGLLFMFVLADKVKKVDIDIIRQFIQQMDEVDRARNEILTELNTLLVRCGEKPFELIPISSILIRNKHVWAIEKASDFLKRRRII